jgi:erythromycin esterase-like protein
MWYFDAVLSVIPSSKIFKIQHVNGLFLNDVGVFFKKKKEKKKGTIFQKRLGLWFFSIGSNFSTGFFLSTSSNDHNGE